MRGRTDGGGRLAAAGDSSRSRSFPRRTRGRGLHANVGLAMRRAGDPGLAESMMVCSIHARDVGTAKGWFQENMWFPMVFLTRIPYSVRFSKVEIN